MTSATFVDAGVRASGAAGLAFVALLCMAAFLWGLALWARGHLPSQLHGQLFRGVTVTCAVLGAFALLLFAVPARAEVRSGWTEACIGGLQSYPSNGVGTIGYCASGYAGLAHAPDGASCAIYHAADFPGQSFACGPGTHLWNSEDMASLPTGAGGPEPDAGVIDWSKPAHVGQVILFALALGFGFHGYATGARS